MNKDFWDKVNRLEELADKATQGEWTYDGHNSVDSTERLYLTEILTHEDGRYIAAANPAMIKEMIARMRMLEKKADMLATFCTDLCPNVPYHVNCQSCDNCPGIDCKNSDKPETWREAARKAVSELDNA